MIEITSLRNGMYYQEDGVPLEVLSYEHTKKGRGNATVKIKVKNLLTGSIVTKGYISGKRVEEADLDTIEAVFLYRTNSDFIFEDADEEELEIDRDQVGEQGKFITKGMSVKIILYKGNPLSVSLPIKATFLVKEAPPDARGNSANSSNKEVLLENGVKVKVPMFVKEGDHIVVDTRDGMYVERA